MLVSTATQRLSKSCLTRRQVAGISGLTCISARRPPVGSVLTSPLGFRENAPFRNRGEYSADSLSGVCGIVSNLIESFRPQCDIIKRSPDEAWILEAFPAQQSAT
jgi:hypothetical protein